MEFNIWNSIPRKIKCISNEDNKYYEHDENSTLLIVGKNYTVEDVNIYSWNTIVFVKEIPNTPFNSCCFEEIEEQGEEKESEESNA